MQAITGSKSCVPDSKQLLTATADSSVSLHPSRALINPFFPRTSSKSPIALPVSANQRVAG